MLKRSLWGRRRCICIFFLHHFSLAAEKAALRRTVSSIVEHTSASVYANVVYRKRRSSLSWVYYTQPCILCYCSSHQGDRRVSARVRIPRNSFWRWLDQLCERGNLGSFVVCSCECSRLFSSNGSADRADARARADGADAKALTPPMHGVA